MPTVAQTTTSSTKVIHRSKSVRRGRGELMKNTVSDHHHTMNVNRRDTGIQPLGLEVRGRE
jgi:hypothetical protein